MKGVHQPYCILRSARFQPLGFQAICCAGTGGRASAESGAAASLLNSDSTELSPEDAVPSRSCPSTVDNARATCYF